MIGVLHDGGLASLTPTNGQYKLESTDVCAKDHSGDRRPSPNPNPNPNQTKP